MSTQLCGQCRTGIYRYPQPGNPDQWVHYQKPEDGHFARPATSDRDHAVYELMQSIRRKGERIAEAMDTYEQTVERVKVALADDDPVRSTMRFSRVEDPAVLLDDMRDLCGLAISLGVSAEAVVAARRGEFVSMAEMGIGGRESAKGEGWLPEPESLRPVNPDCIEDDHADQDAADWAVGAFYPQADR